MLTKWRQISSALFSVTPCATSSVTYISMYLSKSAVGESPNVILVRSFHQSDVLRRYSATLSTFMKRAAAPPSVFVGEAEFSSSPLNTSFFSSPSHAYAREFTDDDDVLFLYCCLSLAVGLPSVCRWFAVGLPSACRWFAVGVSFTCPSFALCLPFRSNIRYIIIEITNSYKRVTLCPFHYYHSIRL